MTTCNCNVNPSDPCPPPCPQHDERRPAEVTQVPDERRPNTAPSVVCGDHWEGLSGAMIDGSTGCPWCLVASLQADVTDLSNKLAAADRGTSKATPVDRDVKPEKLGELAELLLPMAREWTRRLSLGQSDSDDESLATLLAKVHGMGRRCGEEFPVDPIIARLSEWVHEFGKALKPSGADTYGEGVRACKAQVAAILATRLEGATPCPKCSATLPFHRWGCPDLPSEPNACVTPKETKR